MKMFFRFFLSLIVLLCGYNCLYASHQQIGRSEVQNLAAQAGIATFNTTAVADIAPAFTIEHQYKYKLLAENEFEEEERTLVDNLSPKGFNHFSSLLCYKASLSSYVVAPLQLAQVFCYPQSFRCILLGVLRI